MVLPDGGKGAVDSHEVLKRLFGRIEKTPTELLVETGSNVCLASSTFAFYEDCICWDLFSFPLCTKQIPCIVQVIFQGTIPACY